jgi:hypothetical protein
MGREQRERPAPPFGKEEAMRQAMSWRIAAEDLVPHHQEAEP